MFTKTDASAMRQEFWTTLGRYMQPVPSADVARVNWINYRTGIKHLHFWLEAGNEQAVVGIEISHPDLEMQELFYEQLLALKNILEDIAGEAWFWDPHIDYSDGVTCIYQTLPGVSIYDRGDWPALIAFFKSRLIALDQFWALAKYSFDALK